MSVQGKRIDGLLQLPTPGPDGGIIIGGDVKLYRYLANRLILGTDDSLQIAGQNSLYFRDTGIVIKSTDDGHLDLYADTSIDLNSTINIGEAADLVGFMGTAAQAQQAHIIDADGQLADITTKFNTLLADLEGYGLLAAT